MMGLLSLCSLLTCLAKMRRPDVLPDPVVIPALTPLVGPELDRLLCSVRALKYYVRATADPSVRKGRTDLFIPYSGTTVP